MIYLSYSFQFLSFAAGMVSLFIAIQLFSKYKFHYLKSNIFLTAGYLIMMLINTIGSILNIENGNSEQSFSIYNQVLFFILPIVLMYIYYYFKSLFDGIINHNKKKSNSIYFILIIFIFVQSSILLFRNKLPYYLPVFPMLLIQVYFYIQIFRILTRFRNGINQWRTTTWYGWLRKIYSLEIGYFIVLIVIVVVNILGLMNQNFFMVLQSFTAMIINPLLMYLFVQYHDTRYNFSTNNFDQLLLQYEITDREKEIVELVCQGKTNKEIAEILFLSPLTVRDHLSNIYRKTNVNNRTKLAGLFM